MSRKTQASGDIARGHVSEQMRSSQGALVWTDKPWVNLKPVPTVSRDTPLENFPDCQITLARDGLTLPEIGERITALCGVRVIFSPDALAVGQSSGTTRALNGPLPVPDNNGRIPLDQLGGAVDTAGVTATPLVLSGLRWQGKLSGLLDMIAARTGNSGSDNGGTSGNGGSIGWLSDDNGIPCISGTLKSNASTYLPTIGLLGLGTSAGDALTANQYTSNTTDGGGITSALTGNAGQAVLGQALGGGFKEVAQWVKERYAQTFDAVYVPPGAKVAVHITRQLNIDYAEKGRRVKYDFTLPGTGTTQQGLD
ncbi:hypothetical protein IRK73_000752 [Salmonella enterica]|nr:hypothetical protein [Salmonella enterica]